MKNIIHMKVPMEDSRMVLTYEVISKIAESTKAKLGDEYTLLVTPMETTLIDGDTKVINIDCKDYSANELKEIIEKAWIYDDLNK